MADDDKLVIRSYLLPKKEEDEYLFIYVKDKVCNIMKKKKKIIIIIIVAEKRHYSGRQVCNTKCYPIDKNRKHDLQRFQNSY